MVDEDYPSIIPFWNEPIGFPLHLRTAGNLNSIGDKLGMVYEVDATLGKINVDIDSSNP